VTRDLLLIGIALIMATPLACADQPAAISTRHGRIFETPRAGLETQGFIEIDNPRNSPDTLTGAACPIADRTSIVGPHGNAIDHLTVAAGKKLLLTAQGPHLLLQSPHFSIDPGGAVPCSLMFQNAGEISVYLYPISAP
jgi:copper(I)-binding protein